jgi:hypothetical protein
MSREPDFVLALLKGAIEHGDEGAYFGSTLGLAHYASVARRRGLVDREGNATAHGREVYEQMRLDLLPKQLHSRAYMWDWDAPRNEKPKPTCSVCGWSTADTSRDKRPMCWSCAWDIDDTKKEKSR